MHDMTYEIALNLWAKKEYFSKGKRGYIYLSKHDDEVYVIKSRNPESKAPNTIFREYENNVSLNKYDVGPKMYYYEPKLDFVVREFINGENFFDWIKNVKDKKKIKEVFLELLNQCKRMDDAGINKLEMTNPHKDLLIQNNMPVIIDFERCKNTINPKNVTQVCQFITSGHINNSLKNFEIEIDREKILKLSEIYKKEIKKNKKNVESFNEIKKEIKKSFT